MLEWQLDSQCQCVDQRQWIENLAEFYEKELDLC